jgi:hypothetical protein
MLQLLSQQVIVRNGVSVGRRGLMKRPSAHAADRLAHERQANFDSLLKSRLSQPSATAGFRYRAEWQARRGPWFAAKQRIVGSECLRVAYRL